jgi:peptidoglycan/LPS O-acetylase OafA/YrhL
LVWSFLVGGSLYFLRSRTPWSPGLAIAALALTALSLCEGYWNYLLPFGVGYLTVFIGATSAPRVRWLVGADYSYGVYLYHWVIIQAVADRLPRIWFVNAAVSFPAMIAVAALSWHLLEHRALALRAPLMIDDAKGRGAALLLSAAASLILLLVAALRHLG